MTETKLTPIEIKEVIEKFKPEGFTYIKEFVYYEGKKRIVEPVVRLPSGDERILAFETRSEVKELYPLFLTRSIEGINALREYVIETNSQIISVYPVHLNYDLLEQFDFDDYKDIDTVKEAVIRYVLKETRNNDNR